MPAGIGEHLSASWPRRRRANPRSPGGPKWLWPMACCRCSFQREIVGARGRPGETSGLGSATPSLAGLVGHGLLVLDAAVWFAAQPGMYLRVVIALVPPRNKCVCVIQTKGADRSDSIQPTIPTRLRHPWAVASTDL